MGEQIIIGIVLIIAGWILGAIFPQITNAVQAAITRRKKKPRIEKNTVFMPSPFPIAKSPKGYIYFPYDSKEALYCGKCYTPRGSLSDLVPLERIGGKFSKKYACPACKAEYKA